MNEKDNFALVPRPPSAVAKGGPGTRCILSDMFPQRRTAASFSLAVLRWTE